VDKRQIVGALRQTRLNLNVKGLLKILPTIQHFVQEKNNSTKLIPFALSLRRVEFKSEPNLIIKLQSCNRVSLRHSAPDFFVKLANIVAGCRQVLQKNRSVARFLTTLKV